MRTPIGCAVLVTVVAWLPLGAQSRDSRASAEKARPEVSAPKGRPPLIAAVARRDQKAFDALLRAREDVNAAQPDGATAHG